MKKKLLVIGIIGMFLLTSLAAVTAIGKKAVEEINEPGADLAVEFCPLLDSKGKQYGFYVEVENVGTETIEGPIRGILKVYRGFNKLIPMIGYWWPLTVLEDGQELMPGEETDKAKFLALFFRPPIHLNHFVFELNFDDENPDNNVCEQTALSVIMRFLWWGQSRMYFI